MAIKPILKLRFEQIGFNDFDYRVLEISGFPDENLVTSYKYNSPPCIYQVEECDDARGRKNILVIDKGMSFGRMILKEGELCNVHNKRNMQRMKDVIMELVKEFNSAIKRRDETLKEVGYDTTIEFNSEEIEKEDEKEEREERLHGIKKMINDSKRYMELSICRRR